MTVRRRYQSGMTCLVIGGTGTVGRHVVSRLAALGHPVVVATREPARVVPPVRARALQLEDLTATSFAGVERVFCMVPRALTAAREHHAALVAALAAAGVARVVLMTGFGVDRAVGSPLHALEDAIRNRGIPHAFVRPNYLFQSFAAGGLREGIARRDEVVAGVGDGRISFVDARDVGEVAAAALLDDREPARAFELTGPAAVAHAEIADAIGRAAGRVIHYRPQSEADVRAELAAAGHAPSAIAARLGFLALARDGQLARVTDDVARVLGRPPRTLEDFAADHRDAWRSEVA